MDMLKSLLFSNILASCLLCVQMSVWEPLLIVNVTGNVSMSPLDIWNEHPYTQRSENSTTEQWIVNVTENTPFVSERITTWDTMRPEMVEVQAVRYKDGEVHVLLSILFNTTTVASSSLDDWMREEYVSDPNRSKRVIESPSQLQSTRSMFRYNYESTITAEGKETLTKGGIALLVDTRDVSRRGSLLLTSHTRNIGAISDIVANLHLHTYQSRLYVDVMETFDFTQERIGTHNHKIVRAMNEYYYDDLSYTIFEMADGVTVKNIRLATLQQNPISFTMVLGLKGGNSIETSVQEQWYFESNYDMGFLYLEIAPYMASYITDLKINITYSYLPYDVADYFVIRGRFAACSDPPDMLNTVMDGTGTIVGSFRTYNCTPRSILVSGSEPATSQCQSNGSWSRPNITCGAACSNPPDMLNTVMDGTGTIVGSLRTYNCTSRSILVSGSEPATSQCQSNGSWSRPNITCGVSCGDPVDPPNTVVMSGTGNIDESHRTYKCAPGTSLISGISPVKIICRYGIWPRAPIECGVISTSATLSVSAGSTNEMTTSSESSTQSSKFDLVPLTTVATSDTTTSGISTASDQTSDQVFGDKTTTERSMPDIPDTMATAIPTDRVALETTAFLPTASVEQGCVDSCPCKTILWGNITNQEDLSPSNLAELKGMIKQLKSQLTVNKTGLSTYKGKKISASDGRSSAAGIGTIGIAIIVIVVLLVVIADVTSFMPSGQRVHSTSRRVRAMKQRMESRL